MEEIKIEQLNLDEVVIDAEEFEEAKMNNGGGVDGE